MRKLILGCLTLAILSGCAQPSEKPDHLAAPPAVQKERATSGVAKAEENPSPRIDQLLKQLASSEFKERESAQAELATLLETKHGTVLGPLQETFKTEKDPQVKDWLERVLKPYNRWHITPAVLDAIPNIIELLEEDSRSSMRTAVEALQKLDPKDTRGVLFAIICESKHGKRRCLEALLENADSEVVVFFISRLVRGEDDPAWIAEHNLKRLGEKSFPLLKKLLHETENLKTGEAAARVFASHEKGCQVLLECLATVKPKMKAAVLLGFVYSSKILPPNELLISLLKDNNPKVRYNAAGLLGKLKCEKAFEPLVSVVAKDKNAKVRASAIYALFRIGETRAVPIFLEALRDADENVRFAAVCGLDVIQDGRAIDPLIKALEDPERQVVDKASSALVEIGQVVVPRLLATFKTANPSAREAIIETLWFGKDKRAIPVLINALKDENSSVRCVAVEALGDLKEKEAVDDLIAVLKDTDSGVRIRAAAALGYVADKRATTALVGALKDEDREVRRAVATALGTIGDDRAVEPLIAALKDADEDVINSAVNALAQIGDRRAFEPLVGLVKDEDDFDPFFLDEGYAEALIKTGGIKAIPHLIELSDDIMGTLGIVRFGEAAIGPLLEATKSDRHGIRTEALEALAMLREEKAFPLLLEALKDKEWRVRSLAAKVISLYRDARAVEPLIASLHDDTNSIRQFAALALGLLGDKRAVAPLIRVLLQDEDGFVSVEAAKTLGELEDNSAIEPLILCLLEDSPHVRSAAARALGSFREKRVVQALIKALKDEWNFVRSAATASLAEIGDKSAISALIEAHKRNSSDYHLIEALESFCVKDVVDYFLQILKEEKGTLYKIEIVIALGKVSDKRAVEPLRELLNSDDGWLRICTATALLRFDDDNAARMLKTAIESTIREEQEPATNALSGMPHPKALPWLIEALGKGKGLAPMDAAAALGKLGGKAASEALLGALRHESYLVRVAAMSALGKLKETRAVKPLIELLASDPEDDIREVAKEVLQEITGQNFGWNYQRWRRWWGEQE